MISEPIILNLAGLGMHLFSSDSNFALETPPIYDQFLDIKEKSNPRNRSIGLEGVVPDHELLLKVNNGNIDVRDSEEFCLFSSDSWSLWKNKSGQYIFATGPQIPKIIIKIKPGFAEGEVFSNFRPKDGEGFYPLKSLDIRLFSNWLGIFGDIILHASGVVTTSDGEGICFAGVSGAGKSTLARSLNHHHSLEVLGEDNLILRYLHGQFFIFGSPWHEDPAMCSSKGVTLKKIIFLDRKTEPGIHQIKPITGVSYLLKTAFIPYYRQDLLPGILDRLTQLAKKVPFFTMNYQLGCDVWESIQKA